MSSRRISTADQNNNGYLGDVTGQRIGNKQAIDTAKVDQATRIDEASATITYVGKAPVGSLTSNAVWKIFRIDESSGLVITYADGNTNFDNVWDSRAGLTYI
jgi:hypothetical protein